MNFYCNLNQTYQKSIEIQVFLKMTCFFENGSECLFVDFVIVLGFSFELYQFNKIKVSTKMHESVDIHRL
jgi:hypothetical protein